MTKGKSFEEKLNDLLCEKKFKNILDMLKNPSKDSYITENAWNIISLLCLTIKNNGLLEDDKDVNLCKKILLALVRKGNPKEMLLSLLEQADTFKDHEFFCLLLEPIQYVLKLTPGKRGKSLQWVLSTLNAHIETLPPPQDLDLQGDEKLLLDLDPEVCNTNYVLSNYLSFIEYFVDEVSFENIKKKEIHYFDRVCNQQEILHRYILKLFYQPLLYHDLHISENRPKSRIRALCDRYIKCLSKICHNVFNLFKYDTTSTKYPNMKPKIADSDEDDDESEEDEDSVPLLAFSNLSYLIFVENIALNFQPFVYSHLYIFLNNLKYILSLLQKSENLIIFKGLYLADTLVNNLDDCELNYNYTELEIVNEFPKMLLHVVIHYNIEIHRKMALDIFTKYITKLKSREKYNLIMQVLSTVDHSGIEGFVINLYKGYLHDALNGDKKYSYFLGKNLTSFFMKIFVLKEGVETDVLEYNDKITTTLNVLRYLLLRDKKEENITGIWDLINLVSEKFLNPLSLALDLSRAHYKQALEDINTERKSKKGKNVINTTVTVCDKVLPNIPLHFQKDIFLNALTSFDVIESILARVKELLSI